jgi:hypothetical protein
MRGNSAPGKEFKMNKAYTIKGTPGRKEILEILRESKDGYQVKITRDRSGWMEERKEFMPKALFESCLRTEYLKETSL